MEEREVAPSCSCQRDAIRRELELYSPTCPTPPNTCTLVNAAHRQSADQGNCDTPIPDPFNCSGPTHGQCSGDVNNWMNDGLGDCVGAGPIGQSKVVPQRVPRRVLEMETVIATCEGVYRPL